MAAGSIASSDTGAEWGSHGRDASEQRYSPLTQVDAANVSQLGLAWFTTSPSAAATRARRWSSTAACT